ncbi:endoplasmic reticulum-based factor for assembly of V-ATPase-domain-containing protein [Cladorrhinum sp. PSN332]|nr:endoplasmic reticulum-based factor for assembly of V-ATPase-domain-containing protein [Cladorrhinum sp. PSN332]
MANSFPISALQSQQFWWCASFKMVLLTMTPSIVEGLELYNESESESTQAPEARKDEPSLKKPAVGNPISHAQIVDLWTALRNGGHKQYQLEGLLKGARVHVPPPPPKPEPSDEYKALMARLRREEEERAYERMTNPTSSMETFSQRFPTNAGMAQAFAAVNRPSRNDDTGDDDITFNDVNRQLMLILNFVLSILGVAASLWIIARWWSTPARLFLTMGGSLLVGIAEVALYGGYIWHLGEAKKKDKGFKEVKEIVQTWAVGADDEGVTVGGEKTSSPGDDTLRQRKIERGDIKS